MPLEIVLATANPHKAAEIAEILGAADAPGLVLIERPADVPDVVEDGATLEDNARLKARALARATGRAALADDTGLFVDVLHDAPGVWSARYAGEGATPRDNVDKLLRELEGVANRRARFVTVALLALDNGAELVATGTVEGTIASSPAGAEGFGYDPVFSPDGAAGRTFAQMSRAEKSACSHRGRAFRALLDMLVAEGLHKAD